MNALVQIERGEIGSVRFGCAPLVDQRVFRDLCSLHKEILPQCSLRPTHGDTDQLAEEVARFHVDAAVVTLPLRHPELRIEEIRRDRLAACLRHDDPLAKKSVLNVTDLQGNLTVFYHPQRHPDAHEVLVHMLASAGITIDECSLASHPSEMQMLVKEGHGLADTLRSTLDEQFADSSTAVAISTTGDLRPLNPVIRTEIISIANEAIHNCLLHASASELQMELRYATDLSSALAIYHSLRSGG